MDKDPSAVVLYYELYTAPGYVLLWLHEEEDLVYSLGVFQPDIVLVDVDLDPGALPEIVRMVRDHESAEPIPVVFLSEDASMAEMARQEGVDGFFSRSRISEELTVFLALFKGYINPGASKLN